MLIFTHSAFSVIEMPFSPQLYVCGLYDNYQSEQTLTPDAQNKLDYYINQLEEIIEEVTVDSPSLIAWIEWEKKFKEFYKQLILDAFDEAEIQIPQGIEIYFSGSFAKQQATLFSDLDSFVIYQNEQDRVNAKPVFNNVNNVLLRIFEKKNCLFPDFIGINPSGLGNTVEGLFKHLKSDEFLNKEVFINSILMSKPIFGDFLLGQKLIKKIRKDKELKEFCSPSYYYKKLEEFAQLRSEEYCNIKMHVLRPLDFFLMGLREEYHLYSEDGSHLSALTTLKLLEKEQFNAKQLVRIHSIYLKVMERRFVGHLNNDKELDDIPKEEISALLEDIQYLIKIARERQKKYSVGEIKKSGKISGFRIAFYLFSLLLGAALATGAGSAIIASNLFVLPLLATLGLILLASVTGLFAGLIIGKVSCLIYDLWTQKTAKEPALELKELLINEKNQSYHLINQELNDIPPLNTIVSNLDQPKLNIINLPISESDADNFEQNNRGKLCKIKLN